MESATPGVKSTRDGWLNRYLQARPGADATPFRAVAIAGRMPRTLQGSAPALVVGNIRNFRLVGGAPAKGQVGLTETFESMYASASDPALKSTSSEMFDAISTLDRIGKENYQPANGVKYPGGLGSSLQQVACIRRHREPIYDCLLFGLVHWKLGPNGMLRQGAT